MAKSKLKKVAEIDWASVERQLNGPGIELRKQMREDGVDVLEAEEEKLSRQVTEHIEKVHDIIYKFGLSAHMYCPHENGVNAESFGEAMLALFERVAELEEKVAELSCKLTQK